MPSGKTVTCILTNRFPQSWIVPSSTAVEGLFFCLFLGTLSGMAELGLPHWILQYLWGQ